METNIRQRGTVGGSEKKLTARIDELKRIYGIKNGGNKSRVGFSNSGDSKTFDQILADEGIDRAIYFKAKKLQADMNGIGINTLKRAKSLTKRLSNGQSKFTEEELANKLGIDINTLYRAKSLTTLPTEIQDLIEQGRFPKWESACYFRSWNPNLEFHAAALSKNNCFKMLKNAIIKRFFDIFKFHRMTSE